MRRTKRYSNRKWPPFRCCPDNANFNIRPEIWKPANISTLFEIQGFLNCLWIRREKKISSSFSFKSFSRNTVYEIRQRTINGELRENEHCSICAVRLSVCDIYRKLGSNDLQWLREPESVFWETYCQIWKSNYRLNKYQSAYNSCQIYEISVFSLSREQHTNFITEIWDCLVQRSGSLGTVDR